MSVAATHVTGPFPGTRNVGRNCFSWLLVRLDRSLLSQAATGLLGLLAVAPTHPSKGGWNPLFVSSTFSLLPSSWSAYRPSRLTAGLQSFKVQNVGFCFGMVNIVLCHNFLNPLCHLQFGRSSSACFFMQTRNLTRNMSSSGNMGAASTWLTASKTPSASSIAGVSTTRKDQEMKFRPFCFKSLKKRNLKWVRNNNNKKLMKPMNHESFILTSADFRPIVAKTQQLKIFM